MTNNIFDKNLWRERLNRHHEKFRNHSFLHEWVDTQILNRLDVIKNKFETALYIGHSLDAYKSEDKIKNIVHLFPSFQKNAHVIGDDEFLPIKDNALDLIISNLTLHHANDLLGALIQSQYSLKSDGLFVGALLGGETLYELRQSLQQAETEIYGGISPRVAPFADIKSLGGLMQRTQYALPVIDSERVVVEYSDFTKMLHDLRYMGEGNVLIERNNRPVNKKFWRRVEEIYKEQFSEHGKFIATFEVIFLLGWKPHESQQKPMKPGSAEKRLADSLNVKEEVL